MKKIHKSAIQTTNLKQSASSSNNNFATIISKILKLFPNFDFSKFIDNFFYDNNQKSSQKSLKSLAKTHENLNIKACNAFLEKHQQTIKEIKQKNRPS